MDFFVLLITGWYEAGMHIYILCLAGFVAFYFLFTDDISWAGWIFRWAIELWPIFCGLGLLICFITK